MTRDTAYGLFCEVVDAGFSATVTAHVHDKHMPREHYLVSIHTNRLAPVEIQTLTAIGVNYHADLHYIGGEGMTFFDRPGTGIDGGTAYER